MSPPAQSSLSNRLLSQLSAPDFALLADALEPVDLNLRMVLAEKDQVVPFGYFMEAGIGSVVAESVEGLQAEAGIFGREGFAPIALLLGSDRPAHRHLIQMAGFGHRITAEALQQAAEASSTLRTVLTRYVHTLNMQTGYTALSNAVHPIEERLARWLLMCHDRSEADEMALTHEFLALMLAVRRPSVTTSLHVLEGNRFISTERGYITIRNRAALERFAHDGYGAPEAEYLRLLGPMR